MKATETTDASAQAASGRGKTWLARQVSRLLALIAAKGVRYWITASIFLLASFAVSPWLYDNLGLSKRVAVWFQVLFDHGPRTPIPKFTRLVLIGDTEFYTDLAGRIPTDRKYIASLVSGLATDRAHANVIALDFDLRLPNIEATSIPQNYREETCDLIDKIHKAVQRGSRLVLATTVWADVERGWRRLPDVYQAYGLCTPPGVPVEPPACDTRFDTKFTDEERKLVTCGHIHPPSPLKPLEIPMQLPMDDGSYLDSFALAIARATDKEVTEEILDSLKGRTPLGHFMRLERFIGNNDEIAADKIHRGDYGRFEINGKTVIIGANWHSRGVNQGRLVDLHDTPAGPMVGAAVLANYVEALFDSMTAFAVPEWALISTEVVFGILAALVFAAYPGWWGVGALLPLIALMFLIQWIMLDGIGLYFDVFVPLFGLTVHSFGEHLFGAHANKPAH